MRFGIFYEHQLPRPWVEGAELRLFQEALDQVELADKLGLDFAWEVEHHFLEEYSHSSAPEVFLAACSQRTKRMRLGHGIVLMPPSYNHPARVAERIATLDLVSGGRVEWGTGQGASAAELGGFGIDPEERHAMWLEAVTEAANMLVMDPYPGYQGKYFSMPCRNLVPKSVQKPHPPLWVACSKRDTIHQAARNGIGALTFAFVDPSEAVKWVAEYYDIIKSDACVPIGHTVNANIAMVAGFSCHADEAEARRRGLDGFRFFGYALGHHYIFGEHTPGRTSIWANYREGARHSPYLAGRRGYRHARADRRQHGPLRGDGPRPGHLPAAGRQERARPHLRLSGAVREVRDAGVQRPSRGARGQEAGGAGALYRARRGSQTASAITRRPRHPDHRRARPAARKRRVRRR